MGNLTTLPEGHRAFKRGSSEKAQGNFAHC
jgi:hypothetical protein